MSDMKRCKLADAKALILAEAIKLRLRFARHFGHGLLSCGFPLFGLGRLFVDRGLFVDSSSFAVFLPDANSRLLSAQAF